MIDSLQIVGTSVLATILVFATLVTAFVLKARAAKLARIKQEAKGK